MREIDNFTNNKKKIKRKEKINFMNFLNLPEICNDLSQVQIVFAD